jgi:hypothetical protein
MGLHFGQLFNALKHIRSDMETSILIDQLVIVDTFFTGSLDVKGSDNIFVDLFDFFDGLFCFLVCCLSHLMLRLF